MFHIGSVLNQLSWYLLTIAYTCVGVKLFDSLFMSLIAVNSAGIIYFRNGAFIETVINLNIGLIYDHLKVEASNNNQVVPQLNAIIMYINILNHLAVGCCCYFGLFRSGTTAIITITDHISNLHLQLSYGRWATYDEYLNSMLIYNKLHIAIN